ncbi:hypothetical protein QTP88_022588 [Uroleucon formosanum]
MRGVYGVQSTGGGTARNEVYTGEKIQLRKRRVNKETPNFSSFRRLNELISNKEESICLAGLKSIVIEHLDCLTDEFMRYFPDFSNESLKYTLTSCLFSANVDTLPDTFQEQAIELKNDSRTKVDFNSDSSLEEFWQQPSSSSSSEPNEL